MEVAKTILTLQFSDAHHPWLGLRALFRVLMEDPKAEIQGQPVVVERKKKRERITLQVRALIFEQESVTSIGADREATQGLLGQLNEACQLSAVRQLRHDLLVIEPFSLPFHELVALLKRLYLRPDPMIEAADDIGILFDQHQGDVVKHVQIGPMVPTQLQSMYLAFPRENLPEQFTFVSLGYEENQVAEFSIERTSRFLQAAVAWQTSQLHSIMANLKQSGGA